MLKNKSKEPLRPYRQKRDFSKSPEPSGQAPQRVTKHTKKTAPAQAATPASTPNHRRVFVVQMHDARRLHYDFRLEVEGALASWAIPKGPSMDPRQKHLAVKTEDHPLEYASFEGMIPPENYGAGPVIVWDGGVYENLTHDRDGNEVPMSQGLEEGHVKVFLEGSKLRGAFALTRTSIVRGKENWILVKMRDGYASADENPVADRPESILTGRTVEQVAAEGVKEDSQTLRLT